MQNNQAIFESLFNRNFTGQQHTDFLKEITDRHPYFSPAQFFLLQQLQDDAAFEKQAVKTNILFNNPRWLNFQLLQTNSKVEVAEIIPTVVNKTPEPALEIREPVLERHEPAVEKQEHLLETPGYVLETAEPISEIPEPVLETVDDLPDNTDAPEPGSHAEEKEIEPMKITLKMPEEKTNLTEAMLFEPMHMVDYFASQGIKLPEDVQTGDKLGKQLKSFTEWLKTMKKVHVADETASAEKTDSNIQVLAENSNTDAGVLTESMAEVFAKQGKPGKATEVYQKLSLLNPAKSTYFAAKIENLKEL